MGLPRSDRPLDRQLPSKGRRASELAITAGAYFTASYVLAAGKAGWEGGVRFIGGSFVGGPDGTILAKARTEGDEVVAAELDLENVRAMRARWNFDLNRRPDTYVLAPAPSAPALALV